MKHPFKLIILPIIFFITTIGSTAIGQHHTINIGHWENNNTWLHDAPPYNFNNDAEIKVNETHEVIADSSISFNNNCVLDIDGSLTINGNFKGRNNLKLNVSENATFIVNGDVHVINNAVIVLDGDMQVENLYGFNENTNYLLGEGNLHLIGEIDGFNTDYFNGNITNDPLPIELVSFNAYPEENDVVIKWITASELNNDYFTIERSQDLHIWNNVTHVDGAGNSNHYIHYDYTDNDIAEGIWYYRLKQTDYDGQYKYYSPVAVNITNATEFKILHVNNTGNEMQIEVQTSGEPANLIIADVRGVIINNIAINAGNDKQYISYHFNNHFTGNIVLLKLYNHSDNNSFKYLVK